MPAVIESTLYESPGGAVVAGSTQQNSRDDLRLGYQVTLRSVQAGTTYSWTLAFASDSPGTTVAGTPFDGTDSVSALLPPEGSTSRDAKFNVDFEGTYLIRLTVDAGLPTESSQFIRARVLTLFGSLKLIAAGERRDENGVIPVDATPEGWANDQNANMQRIGLLLRRVSHSGRILFVDSNRGRDFTEDQDDYDNVLAIPGPDTARPEATGIKLRAMAHGDFSSINSAIAYAAAAAARGEPAPSAIQPYFIVVRKGLYAEDLNLTSFVHIIGDDEPFWDVDMSAGGLGNVQNFRVHVRSVNVAGTGTHRYNPLAASNVAQCYLFNLLLTGQANTTLPVLDHLGGALKLYKCAVIQNGDAVNQGEAVRCVVSNVAHTPAFWAEGSLISTEATTADRAGLRFNATGGVCYLDDTLVVAESCQAIVVNEALYTVCECSVRKGSFVIGTTPYSGYGSVNLFLNSSIMAQGGANPAINVNAFAGGPGSKPGDVLVEVQGMTLSGTVAFETAGAVGATQLTGSGNVSNVGAGVAHTIFPDAPGDLPNAFVALFDSETVKYEPAHIDPLKGPGGAATINVNNRLPKSNVQEAIDILVQAVFPIIGSPFYSLHSAYSGLATLNPPTLGTGLGRTILANGGAVQVTGGTAPFAHDDARKDGGLQVESVVDIGGLISGGPGDLLLQAGHSEISLNPNMMGVGPVIALGRAVWTNGVNGGERGFPAGVIRADTSTAPAAPALSPYHLHLRTTSGRASGTGGLGNIYIAAGGINDPANGDRPGDVHINGGYNNNPGGGSPTGDIWIVPGDLNGGAGFGSVWFAGTHGTPATLTAAGPWIGGTAGAIIIGTPNGVELFTFTGAEANVAAATALFNATARGFIAIDDGATITLFGPPSPASDIVCLGDDGSGVNVNLGDFLPATATFVAGAYGDQVSVDVPVNGRLRVNGDLEVTGAIIGSVTPAYKAITGADPYPYTSLVTELILGAQIVATIDRTIVLNPAYPIGTKVVIKDELGLANAIAAPVGQMVSIVDAARTFDGVTPLNITTAFGAVTLYKNSASNWSVF
jgi:hypothetical protein